MKVRQTLVTALTCAGLAAIAAGCQPVAEAAGAIPTASPASASTSTAAAASDASASPASSTPPEPSSAPPTTSPAGTPTPSTDPSATASPMRSPSAAASAGLSATAASSATTVAPYVDLINSQAPLLDQAISQHGLTAFTAAFVTGSGCTPIWGDTLPVANDTDINGRIGRARAAGATPIVSFGGATGIELAISCTDQGQLTRAYQNVIDTLDVTHLDFDIEGGGIADSAANARRFAAITALKAANPGLVVSFTLPVAPDGLAVNAQAFVRASAAAALRPDLVNVMAMDYYGQWDTGDVDMGRYATQAAGATLAFLRTLWSDAGYSMIGITPMIGQNDAPAEVFTLDDAREVVAFGRQNGVGRLSFWAVTRDQACGAAGDALYLCSRIDQQPLAFTGVFTG